MDKNHEKQSDGCLSRDFDSLQARSITSEPFSHSSFDLNFGPPGTGLCGATLNPKISFKCALTPPVHLTSYVTIRRYRQASRRGRCVIGVPSQAASACMSFFVENKTDSVTHGCGSCWARRCFIGAGGKGRSDNDVRIHICEFHWHTSAAAVSKAVAHVSRRTKRKAQSRSCKPARQESHNVARRGREWWEWRPFTRCF